MTQEVVSKLF